MINASYTKRVHVDKRRQSSHPTSKGITQGRKFEASETHSRCMWSAILAGQLRSRTSVNNTKHMTVEILLGYYRQVLPNSSLNILGP